MSSLFGAMTSAIGGLEVQTMRFGTIADNIANSSSVGYKTSSVNFKNTLGTMAGNFQLPGSVTSAVRQNLWLQGELQSSGSAGSLALLGSGFFAVTDRLSNNGAAVASNGNYALTRRGDFNVNKNGNLVNSTNMALLGVPIPSPIPIYNNGVLGTKAVSTGQVAGIANGVGSLSNGASMSSFVPIQISPYAVIPAVTSSNIYVGVNLPAAEPLTGGKSYGTSFQAIDSNGVSQTINLTFTRAGSNAPPSGNGAPPQNVWNVTVNGPHVTPSSFQLSFDASGRVAKAAGNAFNIAVNGTNMKLNFDGGGAAGSAAAHPETTQFSGGFSFAGATTDGLAAGQANGWSISQNGVISQNFTNGVKVPRYQIGLGSSPNNDGLEAIDGEAWVESPQSGKVTAYLSSSGVAAAANGSGLDTAILSGALEGSTVDLAAEFSALITSQSQYTSNTKVMGVIDHLTEVTAQLGR